MSSEGFSCACRRILYAIWSVGALLLSATGIAASPQRVMSLNLCTDQLLLALLPPERITSVTYLSRAPYQSYLTQEALRVGVNHGLAEEVVAQRPDLVITGQYSTPATRQLLKRVGIAVLELPEANSFPEIRDLTRRVGYAVGAVPRAEALLQQMDATLASLAAHAPRSPISIIAREGGGFAPGTGTLFDAIVSAAGGINIAARPGLTSARLDVERLLLLHADLLAVGDATVATPSLDNAALMHPLVRRIYAAGELVYPELLYGCGLPQSAQAARQLQEMMLRAVAQPAP